MSLSQMIMIYTVNFWRNIQRIMNAMEKVKVKRNEKS